MTKPPPEIYFDTNATSDFFRKRTSREEQLRTGTKAAVRSRNLKYVTSVWSIEELSGIAKDDWRKFRRVIDYLVDIQVRLTPSSNELVVRELRRGRPLQGEERFLSATDTGLLFQATTNRSAVVDSYEEHRSRAQEERRSQQELREEVRQELREGLKNPRRAGRDWATQIESLIDDWARAVLASGPHPMLDTATAQKYPLARVPTARRFAAYSLARYRWYLVEEQAIDAGDPTDNHHYAAAGYFDTFVTGDQPLTTMAKFLPRTGIHPITISEFAARYLGWGPRSYPRTP